MRKIINQKTLDAVKMAGMNMIADPVAKTHGPSGLPILISRTGQALDGTPLKPKITKDGVSVAIECESSDPIEDIIIQTVKSICQKTNEDVGDGTTTAIILGRAILELSLSAVKEEKISPQEVKNSLEMAAAQVLKQLKADSWPINTKKEVIEVATISANGDKLIGTVIAEAFEAVGGDGVVTVDEGSGDSITWDKVDGYQFDRGASGRDAFFNNPALSCYEAKNAAVILFDGDIKSLTDVVPLLLKLAQVDKEGVSHQPPPPIVIIANEFSRDVIQWLLIQKSERGVQFCPVKGPNITHIRTGYYDDLAVFLGAYRFGNGNRSLDTVTGDDIGMAQRVSIDKYKTTLFGGFGKEEAILKRVDQLKVLKSEAESPYDAQVTSDRIAALTSGIAKILVGGHTELELKEKYDRIEDALNASRAAIQEGVVLGGGVSFLRASYRLGSSMAGERILKEALKAPLRQLLLNDGLSSEVVSHIEKDLLAAEVPIVYDVAKGAYTNKKYIIDPLKVVCSAFNNAISIAGLLLTAGGAIFYEKAGE